MKARTQILTIMMMTSVSLFGFAQDDTREARRSAFDACTTELGISKPEPGVHPSDEDREKIKTCLEAKGFTGRPEGGGRRFGGNSEKRDAFKACAEENNIQKPERGSQPSEEDRAKMDSCLASKGFTRPNRQGGTSKQ